MIYEIPLAAVAKKTLAFAWVVDDILRESLADDEADQRFSTVIDGLVSGAGPSETNKVPCGDLVGLISDDFRPTSRQNVDGLFFVSERLELVLVDPLHQERRYNIRQLLRLFMRDVMTGAVDGLDLGVGEKLYPWATHGLHEITFSAVNE